VALLRILDGMTRLRRSAPLVLALLLLFPIGALTPVACCAGIAAGAHATVSGASHCGGGAEGCCERAAKDAAARHCCQGGDSFERPQRGYQQTIDAGSEIADTQILASAVFVASHSSPREPVPRTEPLYTLHSSLLI
jgi:hypothetical protein